MGLEMPPELQWLACLAGSAWPKGAIEDAEKPLRKLSKIEGLEQQGFSGFASKALTELAGVVDKPLWKVVATESAKQGAVGFLPGSLAQGIELAQGHSHEFNLVQALESGGGGRCRRGWRPRSGTWAVSTRGTWSGRRI